VVRVGELELARVAAKRNHNCQARDWYGKLLGFQNIDLAVRNQANKELAKLPEATSADRVWEHLDGHKIGVASSDAASGKPYKHQEDVVEWFRRLYHVDAFVLSSDANTKTSDLVAKVKDNIGSYLLLLKFSWHIFKPIPGSDLERGRMQLKWDLYSAKSGKLMGRGQLNTLSLPVTAERNAANVAVNILFQKGKLEKEVDWAGE